MNIEMDLLLLLFNKLTYLMFRLFVQQYPPYSTYDWTDDGHGNEDDDWSDDGHDIDWIGDGHENPVPASDEVQSPSFSITSPTTFNSRRHKVRQGERGR